MCPAVISLEHYQSGAAGKNIERFDIEKDGQWRYEFYIWGGVTKDGERVKRGLKTRSGQMGEENLAGLSRGLKEDVKDLPDKLGEAAPVNEYHVEITVYDKTVIYDGWPSTRQDKANPTIDRIVNRIRTATIGPYKE